MTTQRIRPEGTTIGSWTIGCTGISTAVAVITFPVTGPAGALIGGLSATLSGHSNYTVPATMTGMIVTPTLTGVAAVVVGLWAAKLGLVRVPTR